MRKYFYFVTAALLSTAATGLKAQTVIDKDTNITTPYYSSDFYEGEESVVIAGATVTMTHEAFNTCGLPHGDGTQITLTDGAKLVFFDSPDTWYPSEEDERNDEYIDDLFDANGNIITAIPYNFVINESATIVLDSKCRLGGTFCGSGDLTLVVGDSTIVNSDFDAFLNGVNGEHGFSGRLTIEYLESAVNKTVQFGSTFPGTCKGCNKYIGNQSCGCWCTIPWTLVVPDGTHLMEAEGSIGSSHIAFPAIEGKFSMYGPATITLKPIHECVYDIESITGGADNRNFEIFAGANVTFTNPIDYTCSYVYPRNKNVGIWVNSQEPCFVNCINAISVRNNDGFVGGNGVIACDIDCKSGTTTHICPGEAYGAVGNLTIQRNVYLNNNNAIDIDFGANGASDRLTVLGQCKIAGANTRLWINLTEDFYATPKAGDYKLIDAVQFIPNTVYTTDTTGIRYSQYEGFDQFIDSISVENNDADKDSIRLSWNDKFQFIEKIDTLSAEVSQKLEIKANKFEDGTYKDSLPEGYSWYPLEWNTQYDAELIPAMKDSLMAEKFFTKGIVSIYGPGYTEEIVNGPTGIESIIDNVGKRVVETKIYTLEGREVLYPVKGVNIIRFRYDDGTVKSEKILRTEE